MTILVKIWIPLLFSFFAVILLYSKDSHNKNGGGGIIGVNSKVEKECKGTEDGDHVCALKFTVDDFDEEEDESEEDESEDEEGKTAEEAGCIDTHENCSFWATKGECDKNPGFMLKGCPKACQQCPKYLINNALPGPPDIILVEREMLIEASKSFGEAQVVEGSEKIASLLVIRKSLSYMNNFLNAKRPTHTISQKTIKACRNVLPLCSFWASKGECKNNISYMLTNCAPACQSCHKIDFNTRCPPRSVNEKPAWQRGDLQRMFNDIVEDKKYAITIHSRSSQQPQANLISNTALDVQHDPWIITLDNFLTDEECDRIIEMGHKVGYKRSKDVSYKQRDDGTFEGLENAGRTSTNAWCSENNKCRQDLFISSIHDRIQQITDIPVLNSEDFQILKYEEGEFYRTHHDFIDHQVDRACGPRILTVFLYLSEVEEGGGTRFPLLNHTVEPRKGRALLWPSVMNSDPNQSDQRMKHEALKVIKGTKFAANAWIHLYNNVDPTRNGCA
eukprot:CAMPEP_0197829894 /NCGR_PEP_ID=MMETSP1437-20131217/6450_1 /TAXON_ID=49252 ORGANISM="Eucampia antarctica, Strain CCMP1452" /NCGR_SAMPLE_ID=MMETSP1437 /ASSEMBLY_ACC=CAM_ASM_001096 /LENGTH=503 /DNA_ID=CAMNT_0043431907 /DNA_START=64 /DNA_END=1575 /DNA_ORIENTATION=+